MNNNEIIYGIDNSQNIVKVEVDGDDIVEFIQTKQVGTIENRISNYRPIAYECSHEPNLQGDNYYNKLIRTNISNYRKLYKREKYLRIKYIESAYLIDTGRTLFKGMTLDDINYASFDIETTGLNYSKGIMKRSIDKKLIPPEFKKYVHRIVKYLDYNNEVSIMELDNIINDADISVNAYLTLWKILIDRDYIIDYGDTVRMVSIDSDKGSIVLFDNDEKKLIIQFINYIKQNDPNLLLTYNGNTFDIPFLMYRAWIHGLELTIGRNDRVPEHKYSQLRMGVGDNQKQGDWYIYGRNYIDLYPAVVKYDFTDRKLTRYGLKDVMSTYGLENENRLVLSFEEILKGISSPPDTQEYKDVYDYCLDDSKDLIRLLKYIGQADFYLTQIIPMNYDTLVFEGNVGRINAIMIRDYYVNKYSLPMWKEHLEPDELEIGMVLKYKGNNSGNDNFLKKDKLYEITDINDKFTVVSKTDNKEYKLDYKWLNTFKLHIQGAEVQADTGIFEHVGDSDISSMYPSLQIRYNIFPKTDKLNTMKSLLVKLREMRLKMKKSLKTLTKGTSEYNVVNGQQLAYKIFLNSNFGGLSSDGAIFKDSKACAEVTRHGRDLILVIRDKLMSMGYKITALDTDGVSYTNGKPIDIEYIDNELNKVLPDGIGIETQTYSIIIVFARKMYYALYPNGDYVLKGAALTARSMPLFYRRFVNRLCNLLSKRDYEGVHILYMETLRLIKDNELPLDEFLMSKRASKSVKQYQQNLIEYEKKHNLKKNTEELYELSLSTGKVLKVGVSYKVYHKINKKQKTGLLFDTGNDYECSDSIEWEENYRNDLNIDYYVNLLNNKVEKLLYKHYDEKKESWYGILSKDLYDYIVPNNNITDINNYRYIDMTSKEDDNDQFKKWKRIDINTYKELIKQGLSGRYVTIQRFCEPEINDKNIVFQPLYFDIDSKDLNLAFTDAKIIYSFFKNVLKISDRYIRVWYSGSKGFHIEVDSEIFGIKPMINLQLINKEIALELISKYKLKCLDIGSIYSVRRMWRLPFSIHPKTGKRKTLLSNFDSINDIDEVEKYLQECDYPKLIDDYINMKPANYLNKDDILEEWIKQYYKKYLSKLTAITLKKPSYKYEQLKGKHPKCISMLLQHGIDKSGNRNKATMILASYFKEVGTPKEQATDILIEWTNSIPSHLTSISGDNNIRSNVKTVINSIYNSEKYNFQCPYIYPLLKGYGFTCNSNCKLKD